MKSPDDWHDTHSDDYPRSMRHEGVRLRRTAMLDQPHIAPLTDFVRSLRAMEAGEVQEFDPLDGGTRADILFLFEKPGPMTDAKRPGRRAGSGFISRNNDDPTAANTLAFMQTIGLPRRRTVTWNAVPWWNGTRDVRAAERARGAAALASLANLLPDLRTIVVVGKEAANIVGRVSGYQVFKSAHPSNLVRGPNRHLWDEIPAIWREAADWQAEP